MPQASCALGAPALAPRHRERHISATNPASPSMAHTPVTSRSMRDAESVGSPALEPDGHVPIVLGVTGHRSLHHGDDDAIVEQFGVLLARIRREAPHSPIVLLTALAEGADRLVARLAMRERVGVIAVLPLEAENYELDFPAPHSRDEFRALVADPRTERCIVAPRLDSAADAPGGARDLQYLITGLFIARNSDVLIALWDGSEARGIGGTAQIVAFRQSGRLDAAAPILAALAHAPHPFRVADAPLDAPQTGLIYHIPVHRAETALSPTAMQTGWLVPASDDASPELRQRFVNAGFATLRHRDALNREGLHYRTRRGARVAASSAYLANGEATPSSRDARAPAALAGVRASFAIADALAIEHQRSIYGTMIALFCLIAIATISLVFRNLARTAHAQLIYLGGYLLLLTIADLAYMRTRRRKSQDRFQDYRAIAEGLRVQFYWRLAGSRRAVSDFYLRKQRSELRWIRDVLRVCALRASEPIAGDVASVRRLWVTDQRRYYARAGKRDGDRRRRHRTLGSVFLLLSLAGTIKLMYEMSEMRVAYIAIAVFAALALAYHAIFEVRHALSQAESPTPAQWRAMASLGALSIIIAIAFYKMIALGGPAIAASLPRFALREEAVEWRLAAIGIVALVGTFAHAYANVRAFGEHQKQYDRMGLLFRSAEEALDRAARPSAIDDPHAILFDLGCEALAEHADWLLLHRARPIELPTAEI
jgi:hypothetical protein